MKLSIPRHITRSFIQSHPEWTFLYGQDEVQKGCFGHAAHCVSEPNCIPIFTCTKMCRSSGYYQDSMYKHIVAVNTIQLSKAVERERPIIPFPKIGEGNSRMKEFAPRSFSWLKSQLQSYYDNIEWIYYEK